MPTYRSVAVILKRQDFKEYDRLLTVYTEKMGKIEVVARGTKKIQSKLAGHLEPFCLTDLMVARGRYRDRVAGSVILEDFNQLKSSFEGIVLAGYFNEVVDLLTRSHQVDQNTFSLIKKAYRTIDRYFEKNDKKEDFRNQFLIVLSFILRLLSLQGFQPSFKSCFYCKKDVKEEKNFLSFSHLSVVCPACQKRENNLESISPTALKILRIMIQKNFPNLKLTNLADTTFWEIQDIVNKLLMAVGEKEIKSVTLLRGLMRLK